MVAVGSATTHSAWRAGLAMVALAALDLVGAILARHWATHRSAVALAGGVVVFATLFVVYGKSLDYAHLTTVTLGWLVLLQTGVIVLDRVQGGGELAWSRVLVMLVVVGLQGWLTVSG
jgi:hypothetical protein